MKRPAQGGAGASPDLSAGASPGPPSPLLQVDALTVRYGQAVAVEEVSLHVARGERVTLIGPNGAGKTSLLNAICGMLNPASGCVRIEGEDVTGASPGSIVSRGVAQVPEGRQVFPSLTVEANLMLAAYGRWSHGAPLLGMARYLAGRERSREQLERVYEQLPQLRELRKRPAGLTSGGEQQMVAIGRALMAQPRLLAIDELSLGLAPLVVQSLVAFLGELNERHGVAILLVEQNALLAMEFCPRAYVLEAGRCTASGSTSELRRQNVVEAAYLGVAR